MWPGPIASHFLGKGSLPDAEAAAKKGDAMDLLGQKCEADFYLSEWLLLHHDTTGVKEMLQAAVDECPPNFVEGPVAKFELKRITGAVRASR